MQLVFFLARISRTKRNITTGMAAADIISITPANEIMDSISELKRDSDLTDSFTISVT